ncbi:excinuclease ABC subunit A [Litorisediminicola beolgyonensis]|uniref:Excinuclease ABC subunit A n=1 Tax=Litorisediminicola beolgyonensis TaxID=1173614 RepID=A0ABW3ZK64_9RHOB
MTRIMTTLALALACAAVTPAIAAPKGCPPGLAKKQNGCTPPGLAKKGVIRDEDRYAEEQLYRYGIGDRIDTDYVVIRDPRRYDLDPGESYYRVGETVYRVDRETREVLDVIGALSTILN